jgi:hypothetical protein
MRNQRENPALEALKHPFAADIPADFHRLVVDRFSCLSERHELKLFILNVLCDYWFFAREWTARIWTDSQVLERGEGGWGGAFSGSIQGLWPFFFHLPVCAEERQFSARRL